MNSARRRRRDRRKEPFDPKKSVGVMDRILVFIGILLIIFIVIMIWIFCKYGSIPDTLCTCVFGACTGELGITGIIQATKNKYRDRQWEKEDRTEKKDPEDPDELLFPDDEDSEGVRIYKGPSRG